jgi:hypothetical protein
MVLPRLHLFELEDQAWLPNVVRDLATDYLHFMEVMLRLDGPVVPLLAEALRASKTQSLVDLCSGGSGPIPLLHDALAAQGMNLRVTLTDRFPNLAAFRRVEAASGGHITFVADPVDARAVPRRLRGFRTIFNSFHHFRPADAKAVLRDAVDASEPIGVFEIPERRLLLILPLLLTPLFVALTTPFIRPFRWRRLLWTYLVPLVPLICLWDGIVSQLRAYTVAELEDLTEALGPTTYRWQAGQVRIRATPCHVTYLWGHPRPPGESAVA